MTIHEVALLVVPPVAAMLRGVLRQRLQFAGLFAIALAESAGVPLPVPYYLLLVYAGVSHRSSFWAGMAVVATCSMATVLGALGLFAVIRHWGLPLAGKYSRYLGRSAARLDRMQAWFTRHRRSAVFVGRLIPGLETSTTVVAGIVMMPWTQFLLSATAAALITSLLYYSIGTVLGDAAARVISRMTDVLESAPLKGAIIAAILVAVVIGLRARRGFSMRPSPEEKKPRT